VGNDGEKNMTTHSLPNYIDVTTAAVEEIIDFARLPKEFGMHPVLQRPMVVEVASKSLCVGVQGFPFRVALPEGYLVSHVTEELATELLEDTESILDSQRPLGMHNEEEVMIRRGRFGHYIKCGNRIAGIGKKDPKEITLEEAILLLQTRGKEAGTKKGKGKAKKAKATKAKKEPKAKATKSTKAKGDGKGSENEVKEKKPPSGYQMFVSEQMKAGKSMKDSATEWKSLDESAQQEYRDKASANAAGASGSASAGGGAGGGSKATGRSSTDRGTTAPAVKTNKVKAAPSGYQLYVSERMKKGLKMKDVEGEWKQLDIATQNEFKDRAKTGAAASASTSTTSTASDVKRALSGYQLFVSEQMKQKGMSMKDAVGEWKLLDTASQDKFKDKAKKGAAAASASASASTASDAKRPPSGYQLFVSEQMKLKGLSMKDAVGKWKELDIALQNEFKEKAKSSSGGTSKISEDALV
jgi:hypothetical protein